MCIYTLTLCILILNIMITSGNEVNPDKYFEKQYNQYLIPRHIDGIVLIMNKSYKKYVEYNIYVYLLLQFFRSHNCKKCFLIRKNGLGR